MGASEEIEILYGIYNEITDSTTDTTVDMESTGVEVGYIEVHVERKGVGIETPELQDTSHQDKNN